MDSGEIYRGFFSIPALARCNVRSSLGDDTLFRQAKKPVDVLIFICIVYFIDISGYGTYTIKIDRHRSQQYIV
jgi:hypothetical protein